jgi:uncharacterized protein (TIGR00369 family)
MNNLQKTHNLTNKELVGRVLELKEGYSKVELKTNEKMIVDDKGLIHGGFTFGLADYAAMVCVNHPNVVLGGAEVKFWAPVKTGDKMIAKAFLIKTEGKKNTVEVEINVNDKKVFSGVFYCYVIEKHVLD